MPDNLNLVVPEHLIDFDLASLNDQGMIDQPFHQEENALCGAGASVFPDKFRIDKSEWDDRIREHEKHKSSADFYSPRYTHQGQSHECVCHASTQLFEVAYNRQFADTKHAVYFSPLALYTRITGGRQWGGSVVQDALWEMMEAGMVPEHDGPDWLGGRGGQADKFRFTLHQTSGRSEAHWPTDGWYRPRDFPFDWQNTARHFRVLEAFTIPDRVSHASAILQGWAICNGRDGHSIPHMAIVKDSRGRYLSKYRDSYLVDRYDTEMKWGGGFAVRSVTMPNDPSRPAGEDMKR